MEGVEDRMGVGDEISNGGGAGVDGAVGAAGIGEAIPLLHDTNVKVPRTPNRHTRFAEISNLISEVACARL